ncbi:hypothetical protein [uncultured Desulfuromonas sp.]|uniref:hypothetical protein n=1 Tax=uncultured Desulfuromonas sp. TaxID=181013 RepID=UPI002AAABCDB|nr:hypothetical protein [uncultured Desulfuromonas sp.]
MDEDQPTDNFPVVIAYRQGGLLPGCAMFLKKCSNAEQGLQVFCRVLIVALASHCSAAVAKTADGRRRAECSRFARYASQRSSRTHHCIVLPQSELEKQLC